MPTKIKQKKDKLFAFSVQISGAEREGLQKMADMNVRSAGPQLRYYLIEALRRDLGNNGTSQSDSK